ncbi:MAG: T7 exonuclease [Candidatus Nanopelagicaceae bacterium]
MSLLIDCDFIVYKDCAAAETEIDFGDDIILVASKFSEALRLVEEDLYKIAKDLGCFDDSILFFSDSVNFRKTIDPAYKGHRNRKKPCGYKRVINALKETFPVVVLPQLEADDAMGIYATREPGQHVIVSPDKDMRQIPGDLYNLQDAIETIDKESARRWHLIQTLAGDQTDGYAGVPGIGVKRAVTLFENEGYTWETVANAFAAKDLDEDVALRNARLAKILHFDNYDLDTKTVKHWLPTTASS